MHFLSLLFLPLTLLIFFIFFLTLFFSLSFSARTTEKEAGEPPSFLFLSLFLLCFLSKSASTLGNTVTLSPSPRLHQLQFPQFLDSRDKMEGKGPLRQDAAFVKLQDYFQEKGKAINIAKEFASDPERFSKLR